MAKRSARGTSSRKPAKATADQQPARAGKRIARGTNTTSAGDSATSLKSSTMRAMMNTAKIPVKCAVTGRTDAPVVQAAHIFPSCWIKDGSYKEKLKGFKLPSTVDKLLALLQSPANCMWLLATVHLLFDSGDAKLGVWTLDEVTKDGAVVKGQYTIRVRKGFKISAKRDGVSDGQRVELPHVDRRLVAWHRSRFDKHLPTAGADVKSDDDDDDADHRGGGAEDPAQAIGAAETLRAFVEEDARLCRHRAAVPGQRPLCAR